MSLTQKLTPKRARNRRLICYCSGYWFPHRRGSRASEFFQKTYGTIGCYHAGRKVCESLQ